MKLRPLSLPGDNEVVGGLCFFPLACINNDLMNIHKNIIHYYYYILYTATVYNLFIAYDVIITSLFVCM